MLAGLLVAVLHRRRLHEVGRRAEQRAADAAVLGELGAADGVDDHAGRVGRVPDLELQLDVERDVAEVAALEADVGPLAVLQPRHVVRRADVDVVGLDAVVDLAGDRLGLGDLLRLQPLALEHVLEVHVAADVELVGAVEHHAPVLEQAGQDAVDDGGADLALDVVADDRHAGRLELRGPLRVGRDEHRDGVDERHAGVEAGLGVVLLGLLGADRQVRHEHVGPGVAQRLGHVDGSAGDSSTIWR